jgi:outer membrane cobalamin receptor
LRWRPESDWAYEQPHPAVGLLPEPEAVDADWRGGWRQNWVGVISTDLAGFYQRTRNTPVWLDANRDGLFEYANLNDTHVSGVQAVVEIRYTGELSQSLKATYRQADAGDSAHVPYLPAREFSTELRWTRAPWEISASYEYLGERYSLPGNDAVLLSPAHLVGSKVDYEIVRGWNVFARLDNMLSYAWEEWAGYPARGFAVLAGTRVSF